MTTRFLLDTNVVSEAAKSHPSPALVRWLGVRPDNALYISSLTVAEIRRGVLEKAPGRRRRELEAWFAGPEGPQTLFTGRVLAFGDEAALAWARLMADGTAACRPRSALDMIVAAIAVAHGLTVATVNERHFRDISIPWVNPLSAAA